ncbi:MAG: hypothetical protein IPO48_06020 [Saprospiraceae bacterium]|nr:hypothetical protein [Saprospiraceae bacterium]
MKNIKRYTFLFLIIGAFSFYKSTAQTNTPAKDTKTAQPTIMAIPFAREGQSLRSVYENDEITRIAITKVKEGFDKRGVNTIDLRAKIKQTNNNAALQENQVAETKDEVIANSGADIYVEVEASRNYSATGNSVNIIMTAYDAFSGESFANKTSASPKFKTDNYEKLAEKAVEAELDNLLNTIQEKFNDIHVNGRTITFNVGISPDSDLNMDSELDDSGDLLSEIIEGWIEKNAFKSSYHMQGVTSNKITFDLVKIPLFDEEGKNFRLTKFSQEFRKFMKTKSVDAKADVQGNNIVFTIKGSK